MENSLSKSVHRFQNDTHEKRRESFNTFCRSTKKEDELRYKAVSTNDIGRRVIMIELAGEIKSGNVEHVSFSRVTETGKVGDFKGAISDLSLIELGKLASVLYYGSKFLEDVPRANGDSSGTLD